MNDCYGGALPSVRKGGRQRPVRSWAGDAGKPSLTLVPSERPHDGSSNLKACNLAERNTFVVFVPDYLVAVLANQIHSFVANRTHSFEARGQHLPLFR
jgi:hypothetical protein